MSNLREVISDLTGADRKSLKGVFYDPKTLADDGKDYAETAAIVAEHGQEPQGYLIFCDCSRLGSGSVEEQIERHV